jgi:MATE family multidrug resistance protein
VTACWQALVGVSYVLFPSAIFSPFAAEPSSRAALMEIGVRMVAFSAAWQLFDSAAGVLSEALRAAGDTLWPLLVRIAIAWLIFVPGTSFTVVEGAQLFGVPIAGDVIAVFWLVVYLGCLALALYLRFRSGRWRTLELLEPSVDEVVAS